MLNNDIVTLLAVANIPLQYNSSSNTNNICMIEFHLEFPVNILSLFEFILVIIYPFCNPMIIAIVGVVVIVYLYFI